MKEKRTRETNTRIESKYFGMKSENRERKKKRAGYNITRKTNGKNFSVAALFRLLRNDYIVWIVNEFEIEIECQANRRRVGVNECARVCVCAVKVCGCVI